jgi:predicted MFS family arabinose efflux permease
MKRVFGFVFGPAKVWERKLVVARIVLIAVMTLVLYALMHSPWKSLVAPLFWVLFVAVVASIAYQYIRRSREQKLASEAEAKP